MSLVVPDFTLQRINMSSTRLVRFFAVVVVCLFASQNIDHFCVYLMHEKRQICRKCVYSFVVPD